MQIDSVHISDCIIKKLIVFLRKHPRKQKMRFDNNHYIVCSLSELQDADLTFHYWLIDCLLSKSYKYLPTLKEVQPNYSLHYVCVSGSKLTLFLSVELKISISSIYF